ncbi:pentatricopeptide repeat-containing protein At4g35850, mitochondrial [Cynara cardunculus var. scolymus]|uniref:pentatricopeptide repeat-containing protein At4g35850, mitochondrial n=1 Tax=Cynara cardunculus var. scolymus TaxID=59895 RepID=UPI000D62AAAB|nr:pentatricopeptide repeat-containing protein At4g35850, mitochondrial [Cynara cardunculus var. scolymus]
MKFLRTISANRQSLLGALGHRHFAVSADNYAKRNYANNVSEYNTVIGSLTSQRRIYLLRDVYDDMMLDGVKPEKDTFRALIAGSMKGVRLQDCFFFRDQMKSMGLIPDVVLYNLMISTCGKCKNSVEATRIFEEMKKLEVKPTAQTFICLINACAAAGRLDQVYAIIGDMTAAGLGLNKFCYAGLIAAHKNKTPLAKDTAAKILELVEQSKGWSSLEETRESAENVMMGISEEELYNIPTANYIHRKAGFVQRFFTVYHVAFDACADLKDVQAVDALQEMLKKDNRRPDVFILMQIMRCYLNSGDIDRGHKVFEEYMSSGNPPIPELYTTLVEGAMTGYTPKGIKIALDTLTQMSSRGINLVASTGNALLLAASGEKNGGYTIANMIWDLMQARNITPFLPAVQAYYNGLKDREIPEDDPRLLVVSRTLDNLRVRFGRNSGQFGDRR